jgi:myo-inositol-1(or 4)-monophosphatase
MQSFTSRNWRNSIDETGGIDERPTWLLNPLDGTCRSVTALTFTGHNNFITRNPNVAISIAFAVHGRVLVGLVLNPFTAHLYSAIRGRGAFLSLLDAELSRQIRTTKVSVGSSLPRSFTLRTEMVAVHKDISDSKQNAPMSPQKLVMSVLGGLSQETGSIALDLCDVASAISDIKRCSHQIWEVAAGWLVVIEARGMILNSNVAEGAEELSEPALGLKEFIAVRPMMEREERESFANMGHRKSGG